MGSFRPGPLWYLFLALFTPLVVVGAIDTVSQMFGNWTDYLWLALGIVLFFLLEKYVIKGKDDTIRTFSHELNHAVVSLLMFKKVHAFHVEGERGQVSHTAGGRFSSVLISLAPYCLPLCTYALLLVRAVMLPDLYWCVDILAGVTVGFYISVFREQTGNYETDINRYRHLVFPYWYIFTFLIFNTGIVLYSLLPEKNVFLAFADTFVGYWHYLGDFFRWLF